MKKHVLFLSSVHEGGEWISNFRLFTYVLKKKRSNLKFTLIAFKDNYKPKLDDIFEKTVFLSRSKKSGRFGFFKNLFNDFLVIRSAVKKIIQSNEPFNCIYCTDYLMVLSALSVLSVKKKSIVFSFQGLRSILIKNLRDINYRQVIIKFLERLSIMMSHVIVVPSVAGKDFVRLMLSPFGKKKKYCIIPNYVSKEFFKTVPKTQLDKLKQKLKVPNESQVVIYSGRIAQYKGLKNLVAAFIQLLVWKKNLTLVIVYPSSNQDTTLLDELMDKINRANISGSIKFLKDSNVNQLVGMYQIADVLVLASEIEFAPLSVLEALASGTPCLGTRVGNMGDILSSIDPLLVLENNNVEEIFNKLEFFFNLSKRRLNQIKIKSKKTAKYYTPLASAGKFTRLLKSLEV